MLRINNNSVICPVVLSATEAEIQDLQRYLASNDVELFFTGKFATFAILGARTIRVPQKCLKSFANLFEWVRERVCKELPNIK